MTSVLFASHTAETSVFRVGSHHLSRELAAMGVHVGHLSTPLSPLKMLGAGDRTGLSARWRTCWQGPTRDDRGLWSAVPFTLLPVQVTAGWSTNPALRTAVPSLRRTVRRMDLEPVDYLLVDQPLFAGLARRLRTGKVVYRPTDVYLSPGLQAAQHRILNEADGIVATSEDVLASLPAQAQQRPRLVLSNGVDVGTFRHQATEELDRAAVVYVGALDERIDWDWIDGLARSLPDVRIDLFGPVPAASSRGLPSNVHLRGSAAYSTLPQTLSRYKVALMPFGPGAANAGRSPMKLYEYLAVGLHVAATPHFATAGDPLPGVDVLPDPLAAAVRIRRVLAAPGRNDAGVKAAAEHDWSRRAAELLTFLEHL